MKKFVSAALFLCLAASLALAMGGPAPSKPAVPAAAPVMAEKVFLIDDFESGSLKSPREWWTFDLKTAGTSPNKEVRGGDEKVEATIGNYSMHLSGLAKSWYCGGAGTYIAKEGQDLSKYGNFQMDVYGRGPASGTIKIELIDDDNNNWVVETKDNVPTKDDRWVYEERVDWDGWKRVVIPVSDFVVDNNGAGDGVWNPQQVNGSGGLLQVQFICIATTDTGKVDFNLDNVSLTM